MLCKQLRAGREAESVLESCAGPRAGQRLGTRCGGTQVQLNGEQKGNWNQNQDAEEKQE